MTPRAIRTAARVFGALKLSLGLLAFTLVYAVMTTPITPVRENDING